MVSTADFRTVAHLMKEAEVYLAQGKLDEAIAVCKQVLKSDPSSAAACRTLGKALHRLGRLEEAMGWYTKTLTLQPDAAEIYANLGSLYAQQQQWQDAIARYQKAIALKPDFAGAYRNLARIWSRIGQTREATACWYQAFTLEPDKASLEEHIDLGDALAEAGSLDEAIACYRYAIQQDPDRAGVYQNLAEVLTQQGKLDEAAVCYRKAIELNLQPDGAILATNGAILNKIEALNGNGSKNGVTNGSKNGSKNGSSKALSQEESLHPVGTLLKNGAIGTALKNGNGSNGSVPLSQNTASTKSHPSPVKSLLAQAETLYSQDKWSEAIALCQDILKLDPKAAAAYKILGNALQATEQTDEAIRAYDRALEIEPRWAEIHANLGSLAAQQQQWQQAISHYQQAIALKPDFVGTHRNLARLWMQVGQSEQATDCWYRVLTLEPATPEEHINLGNALLSYGKIEQAIDCYQQAIELDPNVAGAYQNLAEALSRQQQWQAAVLHYRKALELNMLNRPTEQPAQLAGAIGATNGKHPQAARPSEPDRPTVYVQQAAAHCTDGNWDEAIAICEQAISQVRLETAAAYKTMADALRAKGNLDDAKQYYSRAIELHSGFVDAHINLGSLYVQQQQWQDAIACYQRVAQLEPTSVDAHFYLGKLHQQQQQWQDAIAAYHQVITLQPDLWEVHHNLGDCLLNQQQWQDAAVAYRNAIKLKPDFSWSHNNLGDALMHLEQWQDAATAFNRATQLNPEFHWSHYNLGDMLMKLEQWEGAIAAYRNALQLNPDLPRIQQKLGDALRYRAKADIETALNCYRQAIHQDPNDLQNYHKALEIQPKDSELYTALGDALSNQGQTDEAVVFYQIARQIRAKTTEDFSNLEKTAQTAEVFSSSSQQTKSAPSQEKDSDTHQPTSEDHSIFYTHQEAADLIIQSHLFDAAYYLANNPEISNSGLDPLEHYIKSGDQNGRNPNFLFDTSYYLEQNSDVAKLGMNSLIHYINFGAKEGRDPSPLFDTSYYLEQNADVARAGINPLAHYLKHGAEEGRNPNPLFDTQYYLKQNPDADELGLNPLEHYLNRGAAEGKNPNFLFHTSYYLEQNPDVAESGMNPLAHYLSHGAKEGRNPNSLFDTFYYLKNNPDVAASGLNPLMHYIAYGAVQGRVPWAIDRVREVIQDATTNTSAKYLKYLNNDTLIFPTPKSSINIGIYCYSLGNYFMAEIADFIAAAFDQIGVNTVRLCERDQRPDYLDYDIVVTPQEFFHLGEGRTWIDHPQVSRGAVVSVDQPHTSWFSRAVHYMRQAKVVLDINVDSAAFLQQLGLPAYYLPLGYLPNYQPFEPSLQLPDLLALRSLPKSIRNTLPAADAPLESRPIDLYFIGTLNERREQVFAENAAWLSQFRCFLHMPPLGGCLIKGQDQALDTQAVVGLSRRSKILLNIHRGELPYFEWHRMVFHGLWQKTLVVTEPCHDVPGLVPGEHFIECKLSDMEATVNWLLNTASGRAEAERVRQSGYEALRKQFNMDTVMRRVLNHLIDGHGV